MSCDKLKKKKIKFGFRMYDSSRDLYLSIDTDEMYLSGENFGAHDDQCYIPVFDHQRSKDDQDRVYVGNMFLKKYYIVFDMSPLENDEEYLHVGIGLRNKEALIGE